MPQMRFLLGVNYFPIDRERQSWGEWYAADPAVDFEAMAEMGITLVRVFLSWHLFEQQVAQYDDELYERLDRLVAAAKRNGLSLVITLFYDDAVAELLDVPWRQGRSVVRDDYMLTRAAQVAQRVAARYHTERAILAWDLMGGSLAADAGSGGRFKTWTRSVIEGLKEGQAEQMITVGVDAEALLEETGIGIGGALDFCGFRCAGSTAGAVAYMAGGLDGGPTMSYLDSFLVRLARRGTPVIAHEVGPATLDDTAEHEAAALRVALAGVFANRAAGGLVRRWRDLDADWRDPYARLPYESAVGLRYPDGTERLEAEQVRIIADLVAAIDLEKYDWEQERAAVMMPLERYGSAHALSGLVTPRNVFAAYVAAKQTHLPVDVITEGDDLEGFSLVVVPSVQSVDEGTWPKLSAFVDAGGTVLLSYGGGDVTQAFCELFGLEFMGDLGRRSELTTKAGQETLLGTVPALDAKLELSHFALVSASGAGIVTTDTKGNPLITVHSRGQGKAVFCAAPLERAFAALATRDTQPEVRAYVRYLYSAVGRLSGAAPLYRTDAHQLELAVLRGKEGDSDILLVINHEPFDVEAEISSDRPIASVTDILSEKGAEVSATSFVLPIRAEQVKALELSLGDRRHG
jgi:endo-1,4-beta-mannosidase